jgi:hypothetical protein
MPLSIKPGINESGAHAPNRRALLCAPGGSKIVLAEQAAIREFGAIYPRVQNVYEKTGSWPILREFLMDGTGNQVIANKVLTIIHSRLEKME